MGEMRLSIPSKNLAFPYPVCKNYFSCPRHMMGKENKHSKGASSIKEHEHKDRGRSLSQFCFLFVATDTILLLDSVEDSLQNDAKETCAFLLKMIESLPHCVSFAFVFLLLTEIIILLKYFIRKI